MTLLVGALVGPAIALGVTWVAARLLGARASDGAWLLGLLLFAATLEPDMRRIAAQMLLSIASTVALWILRPERPPQSLPSRALLTAMMVVPVLVVIGAAAMGSLHMRLTQLVQLVTYNDRSAAWPAASGPNVVLVIVDTWRADHTGPGGYAKPTTPRLAAALEQRATWFEAARAPSSSTQPSVRALMTSRVPSHWSKQHGKGPAQAGAWTIARAFRESGYRTGGFTANSLIQGVFFRQGFDDFWSAGGRPFYVRSFVLGHLLSADDQWDQFRRVASWGTHKLRGDTIRRLGREWIAERESPFFLYLHIVEPHWPYSDYGHGLIDDAVRVEKPLSYVDMIRSPGHGRDDAAGLREMQARYDESMREADAVMANILDDLEDLGVMENTLVIWAGDHGEEFFEHGGFSHGHDVFEELIHVPFVIQWPKSLAERMPARVSAPVSLLDILPTLEDYLGLAKSPWPHTGRSLRPLLELGRTHAVVSQGFKGKEWRVSYVEGPWKLRLTFRADISPLETDTIEAFDLVSDPGERRPLPLSDPQVAAFTERGRATLHEQWLLWPDRRVDDEAPASAASPDDEELEHLRALGYVE